MIWSLFILVVILWLASIPIRRKFQALDEEIEELQRAAHRTIYPLD